MSGPIFYEWPNGMRSIAGGTRNEIKLSRPWQKEIEVNPATCPFCTGKGQVLAALEGGKWLLIKNKFTPYPFHEMVIPARCWSPDKVRVLGGEEDIAVAFRLIQREIGNHSVKKLRVTVHVGALAGQNVGHLHYHIVEYMLDGDASESRVPSVMRVFFRTRHDLVLSQSNSFIVGVGGLKAGQCFILPDRYHTSVAVLARELSRLVLLYNKKFKSAQGLSPDFSLALQFLNGELQYGIYTPILNHWGAAEQMTLYEPGCPITLPWPHEMTAEYLKS